MLSLKTKDIETAYKALALCVGVVATPTIDGAIKAGFRVHEVLGILTNADKSALKTMTDKMTKHAEIALEGFTADLTPDAAVLYAQMLELSAPKATDIAASALDPDVLALHMFKQLEDREHLSLRDLFLQLTSAALKPLLDDPEFVRRIAPAINAQLMSGVQDIQGGIIELLRRQDKLEAVQTAADEEIRTLGRAFNLPDADTASRAKLVADILQKAREGASIQANLRAIEDTDPVVQSYLEHANAALGQADFQTAISLLREARKAREDTALKDGMTKWAEVADQEAMVLLLNAQPLEAFQTFERTANGMAAVDEIDAAMRRSNYALALMTYGERYGTEGFIYGTKIIDPLLSETAKELPPDITARLFLHRGTVRARYYAALGHLDGQVEIAAAESDLMSAQYIAAEITSDRHTAATARATAGWLYLQVAHVLHDREADTYLDQAEEQLALAKKFFEELDEALELALVKLDIADLLDRLAVREDEAGRKEKFKTAIALLRESEEAFVEGDHLTDLARAHHLTAKLLWNEAVYNLGAKGAELLGIANDFVNSAIDLRPIESDPIRWADSVLLLGEIRTDLVIHSQEDDRTRGFNEALELIQSAVTLFEQMGTEEQIAKARHSRDRLQRQIEEEGER